MHFAHQPGRIQIIEYSLLSYVLTCPISSKKTLSNEKLYINVYILEGKRESAIDDIKLRSGGIIKWTERRQEKSHVNNEENGSNLTATRLFLRTFLWNFLSGKKKNKNTQLNSHYNGVLGKDGVKKILERFQMGNKGKETRSREHGVGDRKSGKNARNLVFFLSERVNFTKMNRDFLKRGERRLKHES